MELAEAFAFYQTLAVAVQRHEQSLAWAEAQAWTKIQTHLVLLPELAAQVRRMTQAAPREGHLLATLLYATAQASQEEALIACCALALAEACNGVGLWEEAAGLCEQTYQVFVKRQDLRASAYAQLGLATAHQCLNHSSEALLASEVAEKAFRSLDDLEGSARCCLLRAGIYREQGHYREAAPWLKQARELFLALKQAVQAARCDVELAYLLTNEQQFEEALALLRAADEVFLQANAPLARADVILVQGILQLDRGEYQSALTSLKAAQAVYAAVELVAALRQCDHMLANVYRRLGRCDVALEIYFRLRRDFARHQMTIDVARCDMNIGLAYHEQSRYPEALPHFQQAIDACTRAGMTLHVARCQTNMALTEERLGAYDRALEAHQQARETFIRANQALNAAHCEENMARVYLTLHQPQRALELLLSAERGFKAHGSPVLIADNQLSLAQAFQGLAQYAAAHQRLEEARAVYAAEQMKGKEALCQLRLGDVCLVQGEVTQAMRWYQTAREEFINRQWVVNQALCELGLGEACLAADKPAQALTWFTSALPGLDPDFPDGSRQVHYGLARCLQRSGEEVQAFYHLRQALEAIRRGRVGIHTPEGSSAFFAGRQHIYDEALSLALKLNAQEHAVEIVEQGKAQTYLALLHNPQNGLRPKDSQGVLSDLLTQERALQGQIESLRYRLALPETSNQAAADQKDLREQLSKTSRDHEEIIARLFRARPFWALTTQPAPFSLEAFREKMLHAGPTAWGALVYHLSGSNLTMCYLDDKTIFSKHKKLNALELRQLEICTSPHLTKRSQVYGGPLGDDEFTAPGMGTTFLRQLYSLLLPEAVQERLSPERLLIIVPYGPLHNLPFHALRSPLDVCLTQQSTIVYTPSLHIFQLLMERATEKQTKDRAALVVGVSEFGSRASHLPMAGLEARAVHRLLGERSRLLVEAEAQRSVLLEMNIQGKLRHCRILHFATHTLFEESSPLQSRVLLHTGDLTVPDLFDLALEADLVTLSSCESARSEVRIGDEMMGLAQALFHAGAKAVLAGLWNVPDEATSKLMTHFYQALEAGQAPANALRTAQLQMMNDLPPFYWAPFVLLGHPGHWLGTRRTDA